MRRSEPLFILFEDAPSIIRRRNANILSLLNVQDKSFAFPLFIILTEKMHVYAPQPVGDIMMLGGLNMNVIMSGSLKPRGDGRSHIEQYFDSVMEKSFKLPYPNADVTMQNDIMVIDVPVPVDTKFKYSFEKKVEEDEKNSMRLKHIKELEFFLRAHHCYCPEVERIRYLDMKRVKYWLPVVRMAYALQASKGLSFVKESDIYDVYSKVHDSLTRTGKPIYVSENSGDTPYAVIDRKNIEYALKVCFNTQKEAQPDSSQEVGVVCRREA